MSENPEQQPAPPPVETTTTSERVQRDGPTGVPTEDVLAQEAADVAAMNEARSAVGVASTTPPDAAAATGGVPATSGATGATGATGSSGAATTSSGSTTGTTGTTGGSTSGGTSPT
jgi:hypothetical protein